MVSVTAEDYTIIIANSLGGLLLDRRPLVRLSVNCIARNGDRRETGSSGGGGRMEFSALTGDDMWKKHARTAAKQAVELLSSVPAPAGEMTVVLGHGWPGVLIHEAVGHGLEGDFNRKETSAFSKLMGERVASPLVTVVDDGTMANRRGSLTFDDEGTPTGTTMLIENGILKGYMQDRQNATLMRSGLTGNGRRQSYRHVPMPRMTNTYMAGGQSTPEEIIRSVKYGIFAETFGGGQVNITNGDFTFSATAAWLIENGELTRLVKGATLIGNGPKALHNVAMVGNDMALDTGIGTCGKNGQGIPVGVGMPTIRLDKVTVGGSAS
jgi:TldD protein